MSELIDPSLFDRYLAGECTPDEVRRVQTWIAADPRRRNLDAIAFSWPEEQVESAWTRISTRLGYRPLERRSKLPEIVWRPIVQFWNQSRSGLMLAVTLSLVITALVFSQFTTHRSAEQRNQYATGAAQIRTIELRDGSRVTLAPHTKLLVSGDFGVRSREVTIVGEAYFTVNPAKGSPFVVYANGHATRVLGTEFVVRSYPEDPAPIVTVRSGKVAVGSHIVTSMQQVVLSGTNEVVTDIADFRALDFTKGWLSLDDVPLRTARLELNRWYDADIRIEDPRLDTLSVSGDFAFGTIESLIEMLETTFNARVERQGKTLRLYSK